MLKEEQVVSIKKLSNCYLKLISLVRYTFDNKNDNEFHKIFSNVKKIENFNEKLLYLFCVYVINSDEDVIKVLTDTGILSNKIIEEATNNGIKEMDINSSILRNYLRVNCVVDINDMDTILEIISEAYALDNVSEESCVDYNLRHLKSEKTSDLDSNNKMLGKKRRRKILYEKYQGRQ